MAELHVYMTKFLCINLKIIPSGVSMLDAAELLSLACLNCILASKYIHSKNFMVACMKMLNMDKNTMQLPQTQMQRGGAPLMQILAI